MNTTLEAVRAKVIEAVPEIGEQMEHECFCGHPKFNHHWTLEYGSPKQIFEKCFHCVCNKFASRYGRPITLADVLRAILAADPANRTRITLESSGQFIETTYDNAGKKVEGRPYWNLALPLDEQEPEVIEFIHKILCV